MSKTNVIATLCIIVPFIAPFAIVDEPLILIKAIASVAGIILGIGSITFGVFLLVDGK